MGVDIVKTLNEVVTGFIWKVYETDILIFLLNFLQIK